MDTELDIDQVSYGEGTVNSNILISHGYYLTFSILHGEFKFKNGNIVYITIHFKFVLATWFPK